MHIALVNKDVEAVRFLVEVSKLLSKVPATNLLTYLLTNLAEAGADVVSPRADGHFFKKAEVYFGEYPLSFAACLNLFELVELFPLTLTLTLT